LEAGRLEGWLGDVEIDVISLHGFQAFQPASFQAFCSLYPFAFYLYPAFNPINPIILINDY